MTGSKAHVRTVALAPGGYRSALWCTEPIDDKRGGKRSHEPKRKASGGAPPVEAEPARSFGHAPRELVATWLDVLQVRTLSLDDPAFRPVLQRLLHDRCFSQGATLHPQRREMLRRNAQITAGRSENVGETESIGCYYLEGDEEEPDPEELEEPGDDLDGLDRDELLEMIEDERPDLQADELDGLDRDELAAVIEGTADTREHEGHGWIESDEERTDEYTHTFGQLWEHAGTALLTVIREAPDELFTSSEAALVWLRHNTRIQLRRLQGCELPDIVYAYLHNALRKEIEKLWLDGETLDVYQRHTFVELQGATDRAPGNQHELSQHGKLKAWGMVHVSLDAPTGRASGDGEPLDVADVIGFEDWENPRHGERRIRAFDVLAVAEPEDLDFAAAQYGEAGELAEKYGISKAAVYKRTQRARAGIREVLRPEPAREPEAQDDELPWPLMRSWWVVYAYEPPASAMILRVSR